MIGPVFRRCNRMMLVRAAMISVIVKRPSIPVAAAMQAENRRMVQAITAR